MHTHTHTHTHTHARTRTGVYNLYSVYLEDGVGNSITQMITPLSGVVKLVGHTPYLKVAYSPVVPLIRLQFPALIHMTITYKSFSLT